MPSRGEKVAHRRIDVLIRSATSWPLRFSIAASVAIAVPQMPIRWMRVSHCDRRLFDDEPRRGAGDDAARDAERQRHRRRRRCGRTESRSAPARESPRTDRAITARAVGSPAGSSHRGSSPITTRRRARQQPGLPQLRHHAIEPIRPLADFVEEQDVARAADRTRTACRATPAAASACRRAACRRASPGAERLERRRRQLARSARARHSALDERVAVVAVGAPAKPAVEHRPVKRDEAAADA